MFCESVCDPEVSVSAPHGENDQIWSDPNTWEVSGNKTLAWDVTLWASGMMAIRVVLTFIIFVDTKLSLIMEIAQVSSKGLITPMLFSRSGTQTSKQIWICYRDSRANFTSFAALGKHSHPRHARPRLCFSAEIISLLRNKGVFASCGATLHPGNNLLTPDHTASISVDVCVCVSDFSEA